MAKPTEASRFLGELNAGVFKDKLEHVLSEVAMFVSEYGDQKKKGVIELKFTLTKMGTEGDQVMISHKIFKSSPTKRGKTTDEDTTETAMYIGPGGYLSLDVPDSNHHRQGNIELVVDKDEFYKG